MKTEHKQVRNPYLYMVISSAGMLLLLSGILQVLSRSNNLDIASFLLFLFGFVFLIHYIYHLEKKIGISGKWIWGRAVALIAIMAGIALTFH